MVRADAYSVAAAVPDPELPHVTIGDLGMVRSVDEEAGCLVVTITPTYTGCPATEAISEAVVEALQRHGCVAAGGTVEVRTVLTPAWTTDWITPEGRRKLQAAGIAPPPAVGDDLDAVVALNPPCPRCGSSRTRRQSDFGATACKAMLVCLACREPFEAFKPI